MPVPKAMTPKPNQIQLTSGLMTISSGADLRCQRLRIVRRHHDVEIFAERPPDRRPRSSARFSCLRKTHFAGYSVSICLPSSNTAMYAVIICFWPSSCTLMPSLRSV